MALEIDVTSRTHPSIYEALGVPELWRFENGTLQINVLRDGYEGISCLGEGTTIDLLLHSSLFATQHSAL
jgi:hypothetical protein